MPTKQGGSFSKNVSTWRRFNKAPRGLGKPTWRLAGTKLEMGRTEEALNFLEELQLLSVETHLQLFVPDLHRLRAEVLHRLDPKSPRIEAEYREALQLAREQGALALELRAAGGLATRLAASGRTDEGKALLRPVFDRFTEGLATPDLQAAKALLDALE